MTEKAPAMFRTPSINLYTEDLNLLVGFYESIGFHETIRTPKEGVPDHVELKLDRFTLCIATVDAAVADHGLKPNLGGRPMEVVLWTDDTDSAYARLTSGGAPSLGLPHDLVFSA